MHNSELFRRGIVLPLDDQAEDRLRGNDAKAGMHVEYLPIESDNLFGSLWSCGLFREINRQCGTLIDDYEEELLEASRMDRLIEALEHVGSNVKAERSEIHSFLVDLQALAKKASETARPLLFVM